MACCAKRPKEKGYIAQQLREAKLRMEQEIKLLLLGAGESGKSTIAKQLKIIHCQGFTPQELAVFKPLIHENIIQAMQTILFFCAEANLPLGDENNKSRDFVKALSPGDTVVDAQIALHIKRLWADPAVQKAYTRRSEFQLIDSAQFFFTQIDRLSAPDYLPTERDALTVRARTTGIIELEFTFLNVRYRLIDVGGQRSERKKWIHCFQDVKAILFVAALSGYDQTLFEVENRNRLLEDIELFDEICNSTWFVNTSIILFLNKSDLFREKIERKVPLTDCFPFYQGALTYEDALRFVRNEFLTRNRDAKKNVYPHVTCATDTENVKVVFGAIADTVIKEMMGSPLLLTN